jgi:glutaminyl-peptide cyclotransferase
MVLKRWRERLIRYSVPSVAVELHRCMPHDTTAFTQGLCYHDEMLYESTGLEPGSTLRRLDPNDGQLLQQTLVDGDFAEGIAVFHGELYQLSWKRGIARVFSLPSMQVARTIAYSGEGWGLAAHDEVFLMSNGTNKIVVRDASFEVFKTISVRVGPIPIRYLNDLTYANGLIYANVLWRNDLLEIDPANGRVLRRIDCSPLVTHAAPSDIDSVLNGITYIPHLHRFFLTGKRWPWIFEVSIPPSHVL